MPSYIPHDYPVVNGESDNTSVGSWGIRVFIFPINIPYSVGSCSDLQMEFPNHPIVAQSNPITHFHGPNGMWKFPEIPPSCRVLNMIPGKDEPSIDLQ